MKMEEWDNRGMANAQGSSAGLLRRAWRFVRWPLVVLLVLYIALVIYRLFDLQQEKRTQEAVDRIHSQHLTMADVDGSHLPPQPDPKLVDATIAGVDTNGNGIRDDVELAIFKKYPGQANLKLRAAELQYAMALQSEFTSALNTETLIAVIKQEGRAYLCLKSDKAVKQVEVLQVNTDARKKFREDVRQRYMASFGLDSKDFCDIPI